MAAAPSVTEVILPLVIWALLIALIAWCVDRAARRD
jgi:hypothetical protein